MTWACYDNAMAGHVFTIFKNHVFVVRHKRPKVFLWHFLPDGQIELSHHASMQQAKKEARSIVGSSVEP